MLGSNTYHGLGKDSTFSEFQSRLAPPTSLQIWASGFFSADQVTQLALPLPQSILLVYITPALVFSSVEWDNYNTHLKGLKEIIWTKPLTWRQAQSKYQTNSSYWF